MTNKELEQLFQSSFELDPRPELKTDILARADQVGLSEMHTDQQGNCSRTSARILFAPKRWIPVAACFVAVCGLFAGIGWGVSAEAYQTVYIDVNPSVALRLNRFERVSGVEYLNEDAQDALNGVHLKGRKAEDALEAVIEACEASGYINETAELYISTVADDKTNSSELLDKLEARAIEKSQRQYGVNTAQFTQEEQKKAKDLDMSPGKYCLISDVLESDPDYTVDDLRDKPMRELKELKEQGGHKGDGDEHGMHEELKNENQNGMHEWPDNKNENVEHEWPENESKNVEHEWPENESENVEHEWPENESKNVEHEWPENESKNVEHEWPENESKNVEHEWPDPDNGLEFENQNGHR